MGADDLRGSHRPQARLDGNSEASRPPKEFHLDTSEVFIVRSGDSLALTPRLTSWAGFAEGLHGFSDDFSVAGGLSNDIARNQFA